MSSLFDLAGKVAIVTGCRRGLGLAMAEGLAAAGADIVGVSSNIEPKGSEVQRRVENSGRSFIGYRTDFADRAAVSRLARELEADDLRPDILVNNAGTIIVAPAVAHLDGAWDHVLQVNLSSQFQLTREVGRGMLRRGRGKIIFIASLLSFQGGLGVASYTAAKSGISGVTKALANEWAGSGVNVNAIAPGYIVTDNTRPLLDDAVRRKEIDDRIPAGRWGLPEDVVGATLFLASQASDYVHGITLPVDGGWLGR